MGLELKARKGRLVHVRETGRIDEQEFTPVLLTKEPNMTQNEHEAVEVTQADKDAAQGTLDALLLACKPEMLSPEAAERLVQEHFARHRAAHESTLDARLREARREGYEQAKKDAATFVERNVLVHSTDDRHPTYFAARREGNSHGLEYAAEILALSEGTEQ